MGRYPVRVGRYHMSSTFQIVCYFPLLFGIDYLLNFKLHRRGKIFMIMHFCIIQISLLKNIKGYLYHPWSSIKKAKFFDPVNNPDIIFYIIMFSGSLKLCQKRHFYEFFTTRNLIVCLFKCSQWFLYEYFYCVGR